MPVIYNSGQQWSSEGMFAFNYHSILIKPSKYEENILYFKNILNMSEEQSIKLG